MERIKTETLETLFFKLEDLHRKRQDCMKPRVAITNQMKAINRRMNAAGYSEDDIKTHMNNVKEGVVISEAEKNYTEQMIKIGKQLPLHDWYIQHDGCSDIGFCMLMAELGDLSKYPNPAKIWKRMGLSVNGDRADKNDTKGINTGYSKNRRAICQQVIIPICMQTKGKYREIYDQRKAYEIERDKNGGNAEYVETYRSKINTQFTTSDNKKLIKNNQLPKAVINLRAQRYMIKRLLCDMWNEWNKK